MRGWFVTGTDTEVGKTRVAAGLAHLLVAHGRTVAALKPVSAGLDEVDGRGVNDDVQRLRAAGNAGLADDEVGPLQFRAACAPHIAARLEGRAIAREPLLAAVRAAAARAELAVVEGVGGFRVPLAPGWDTADLARDLGLPVVLVVGLRLGCINHALLTAESVRARGLPLAAWVANTVDPALPHVAEQLASLAEGLDAPCWGHVPRLATADAAAVARHLDASQVLGTLDATRD